MYRERPSLYTTTYLVLSMIPCLPGFLPDHCHLNVNLSWPALLCALNPAVHQQQPSWRGSFGSIVAASPGIVRYTA